MSDETVMTNGGIAPVYDVEAITRAVGEFATRSTSQEARFVEGVLRYGVIAGHPETIAAFRADSRADEMFPGVRYVVNEHLSKGALMTGDIFSDAAEAP